MQTPFLDQLLDRINQRARTDIKPILGGLSWLFSGQILIAVIGFLSTVVLANFLDEASFGEYKYLLTLAGMVGVLSLTGLKEATVRAVAQGNEAELYRTIRLILRWSGGMILTASGIAGYYFYMGNEQIALAGLAMLLFVPMATAFSTFLPYLNGKQLYGSFATLRTLYLAAPPAATLGVVWFTTDVLFLFVSFVAAQGIGALLLFLCTIRRYPPNDQVAPDTARYGTHLSIMRVLGNLSFQLDKFLAWHLLGPVQLAAYAITIAVPQQLQVFNKLITTLVVPRFSQRSIASIKTTIWHKMRVLELFALGLVIPYWLSAPYLFDLFFPAYAEYVIYSQVFSLSLLFFPTALLKGTLKAHAKTTELYWIDVGLPLLKIALLLILLPWLGLWGLFVTALAVKALSFLTSLWLFYRTPENVLHMRSDEAVDLDPT